MYFYVDESGHTGSNLFDSSQLALYYGVLSSGINLDLLALPCLQLLRKKLKVERLHAVDLSDHKLAAIAFVVLDLCKKYRLTFDFYRIIKADYALISFFDQVFDSGVNPAVAWSTYWTPLRYAMILKLAELFDDETLKKAWSARISLEPKKTEKELIEVCQILRDRLSLSSDERLKQVMGDALQWAQENPKAIHYGVLTKDDLLQISPNLIGFQYVMFGIAARILKKKKSASKIIVDKQTQFNKAQQTLADFYLKLPRDKPIEMGLGLPTMDLRGMPSIPITFLDSKNSAGLELVDIFLWIFNRYFEGKKLPEELLPIIRSQLHRGNTDEMSISSIFKRWKEWYEAKPDVDEDDLKYAKELLNQEEEKRNKSIKKSVE